MPKKKTEKILKRVNSSFTQKVAAISGMCMAGPRGVLVLPDAGAMVPWSTWPSSCGSFFFCFNLPFHPTIPLPQRHSPHCNSVGVSIGMMLPYPGRTSLHCLLWCSPATPPYIYISIYMCIIAVRTKRRTGPRGPGLPLPWLVVSVVSARLPVPLLYVAARGSGPSLSSFRLPQHLSEPGRRRCPSSPLVFSEYLSAPIFCMTFPVSPCRSLPCGSACKSSLCPLATDAVS